MSWAHKGSNLALEDMLICVPDDAAYFPFDHHLASTKLVYPEGYDNHTVTDYGLYTGTNLCATLRKGEGKYGSAIAIEESTTNKIATEGNSAQDWSLWSHYSSSGYWDQSSRGQYDDPMMGKVFYGRRGTLSSTYLFEYYPFSFTNGQKYTNSIYLKVSRSLPTHEFGSYLNSSSGGQHNVANSVYFTGLFTEWTRYDAIHTVTEDVISTGGLGWSLGAIPSDVIVYAAFPQLEQKAFPTSFVDGSRNSSILKYKPQSLSHIDGTIAFWWKAPEILNLSIHGDQSDYPKVMNIGTYWQLNSAVVWLWASRLRLLFADSATRWEFANDFSSSGEIESGKWYHIALSWSESKNIKAFLNGEERLSKTVRSPITEWTNGVIELKQESSAHPNAMYDDLMIAKKALSPEEIRAIYHGQRPLYDPNRIDHTVG